MRRRTLKIGAVGAKYTDWDAARLSMGGLPAEPAADDDDDDDIVAEAETECANAGVDDGGSDEE